MAAFTASEKVTLILKDGCAALRSHWALGLFKAVGLLVKDNSGQQLVPGSEGKQDHRQAPDSDEARKHTRADSSCELQRGRAHERRTVCDRAQTHCVQHIQ